MKAVIRVVASLFIVYGILRILSTIVVLWDPLIYEGIIIYKIPINLLGGILAIVGGILCFKLNNLGIVFIGISILSYIVGASYEIVLAHGVNFYNYIMATYFWTFGIQILLFFALVFASKQLKSDAKSAL
jgi:hypothetical protein